MNDPMNIGSAASWPPTETMLAAVASTCEEGVQLWDVEGRMTYANRATFRQLGVDPSDPTAFHGHLRSLFLNAAGRPFENDAFPVRQVLATARSRLDTIVKVAGSGAGRWLRLNAYPCSSGHPRAAVMTTTVDVTRFVDQMRQLELQAHYDPLTLLPNRALLADRMGQALARARRNNEMLAACIVDLDGFKAVNDTLGHEAGDRLLQEVARRLRECVRGEDTVARIGGDEFALLVGGIKTLAQAQHVFTRMLDLVSVPVTIGKQLAQVSASLGATIFPMDASEPDVLLSHADEAMYRAKESGKNRFHLFDLAMESRIKVNQRTVQQMEEALASGEFRLYYQPIVDCQREVVVGMEALARWEHPILGTKLPQEFLPLIEHEELVIRLGDWVVETALTQSRAWREAGFEMMLDVNISPLQLLRGDLDRLLKRLRQSCTPEQIRALRFEIVAADTGHAQNLGAAIEQCCTHGVGFVLDDFGTGQSSLPHLIGLGAGALKIGRAYVQDLLTNPVSLSVVKGLIGLGEAFQRRVVAVGAETIDQLLMLVELGCPIVQGHIIARPMTADQVLPWLRSFQPDPRWRAARSGYPTRSDFDLLIMQVVHRNWAARVRQALAGTLPETTPRPQPHAKCRITRWSEDVGRARYHDNGEFQALLAVHCEIHELAERLLEEGGAPERVRRFEDLGEELLGRLHAFRTGVARHDSLPGPVTQRGRNDG